MVINALRDTDITIKVVSVLFQISKNSSSLLKNWVSNEQEFSQSQPQPTRSRGASASATVGFFSNYQFIKENLSP